MSDGRAANASLVDVIRGRALEGPGEPAFTFLRGEGAASTVSRGELDERARGLAGRVQGAGAVGENVLLLCPPGLDYVVAFLGCLYAGARPVPAYPPRRNRSSERLAGIVADAGARYAIGVEAALSAVGGVAGLQAAIPGLGWMAADAGSAEGEGEWRPQPAGGGDVAFLQYTSGSTAAPRGVVLSHANLLSNLSHVEAVCGLGPSSRAVSWLPPYHDMGLIGGVLQPLYTGFPAVLMSPVAFLQSPVRWLRAISEHGATISGGPNFAYDWCVDRIGPGARASLDLSSWRVAFNGAEPLRRATMERFAEAFAASGFERGAIFPCYGLAEATLLVAGGHAPGVPASLELSRAALERSEIVEPAAGEARQVTVVGCGPVLPANRVRIVDPASGGVLDERRAGEIWVSGPTVAGGYWNRPQETAATFGAHVGEGDGPYLRTGDLGFVREGVLYVTGRLKDLVIIRGQNHHAEDLEDSVRHSHGELGRGVCAAFSVERGGEERLVVLQEVSRRESEPGPLAAAIRQAISEEHALQADVVVLVAAGTLPRTSSGKIQRHLCREQYLAGGLTAVFESVAEASAEAGPRESAGELLAAAPEERRSEVLVEHLRRAAASLLRLGDAGGLDPALPLSAHGLDSLSAVALQHELELELGVRLSAARLLEDVSVERLAALVLREWAAPTTDPETAPGDPDAGDDGALSPGQQAMWFLQQVAPRDTAYNVATAIRVRPRLDAASLAAALEATVARHPLLRSSFESEGGVPVRRAHPAVDGVLRVEDAGGWGDGDLRSRLREHAGEPFDLARPPLLRVHLLRRPDESVLLVVIHHIVADFWSLALLLEELTAEYRAACLGEPSGLAAPAASYADYVRWQERELAGDRGERLLAHWRERLAGELPILELPADRPRPRVPDSAGDTVVRVLPAGLAAGLTRLGRAHGATLFATLLAAFQVLLHRHAGQDDVLVGVLTAARSRAAWANVVGYFANPVVVRSSLPGNPRFVDVLRQTRDRLLEAIEHQDLPFPVLVERLQLDRDVSLSPVFQAAFDFQQAPAGAEEVVDVAFGREGDQVVRSGLRLSPLPIAGLPAQFDLVLMMAGTSGGLNATLGYRTALFDRRTAESLVDRLQVLLEAVVAEPERPVHDLPLLTPEERRRVLVDWNATAEPVRTGTVADEFEAQVARTPDAVAVIDGDERVTYRELHRGAAAVAARLADLGVLAGSRVGLCAHRSAAMLAGMLGILEAGAAYVPVDPSNPGERQAAILRAASADVVLAEPDLVPVVPRGLVPIVPLDDGLLAGNAPAGRAPGAGPLAGHLAYVISTSGSMGVPKGVMVSHASVLNFFAALDRLVGCGEGDAVLAVIGIGFDLALAEQLWPLCRGATVVVLSQAAMTGRRTAPRAAARDLELSLFYSGGGDASSRLLLEGARFADERGFAAVWTPERHFGASGPFANPAVTGAALAAVTRRAGIRAGSVVLPLHDPLRVAEEWATVDVLSGGRAGVAFASGGHADEFAFFPDRYAARHEVTWRGIDAVRRLWRGEAVAARSGTGGPIEVSTFPRPVQPELPVWVTSAGDAATFAWAGELGAGLLTHLADQDVDDLAARIAIYRESLAAAGGNPAAGHVAVVLPAFLGEDVEAVRDRARAPFREHLRSSAGLVSRLAASLGLPGDLDALAPADREELLSVAFDRACGTSALLGTADGCRALLERLAGAGVDEIACLIDFGVDEDAVLAGLERLDELRRPVARREPRAPALPASELIERHGVTLLQCTPSTMRVLTADPALRERLSGLRCLMLGGEPLPVDLIADLVLATPVLRNVYGPTETTIWSTSHVATAEPGPVPIGRPIVNTQVYVLDRRLQPVPPGVAGELCIGGRGVAAGYAGQPGLTAERFVPDPFSDRAGARMYRTGDLVRWRPEGALAYLRRMDDQVKVRGHRVELGEIEQTVSGHPGVAAAVVVARAGDLGTELVAYVVPDGGRPFAEADLRRHLATRLPAYMVPATIVPVESLPLTANGKVDRRALPSPEARRRDRDRAAAAPRTDLERRVAGIWADLLQLDSVGVDDDFFELGGHSLLATRIVARVRDELGVDLPLLEFFSAPTVAGLAAFIERDDVGEGYAFDLHVGDEVATVYLSEAEMATAGLPDGAFNLRRMRRGV